MPKLTKYSLAISMCAVFFAGTSAADEFDRSGWYVGAGGGVAVDFADELVERTTMGDIQTKTTGTFNVRGGYRIFSWLALEGMYEGAYGYPLSFQGEQIADFTTHSLLGNAKLIVPTWRLHPYLALGRG